MADQPPFIADQELLELVCPVGDEEQWLRPERFDHSPADREDSPQQTTRTESGWHPVANRPAFLLDGRHRRHCVTIGAGIGKTTVLEQTAYLRHAADPRQLCLQLDISELPEYADEYLSGPQSLLVRKFRESERTQHIDPNAVHGLIQRKIREGCCTLLVDALDQINLQDDRRARALLRELAVFLNWHPTLRCVVSGRPWAILHFWEELFSRTESGHEVSRWKFAKVVEFTDAQIETYLGSDRMEHLKLLAADVLHVPRFLRRIRRMTIDELKQLRTAADVFWMSLQPMLEAGCARQIEGKRFFDTALMLLALLAFEMTRQQKSVRVPAGTEFVDFRLATWKTGRAELRKYGISTFDEFLAALARLGSLNVALEHALLDNHDLSEIHWQDKSLQDFLSAVWLTRYGSSENHVWFGRHLFVRADRSTYALEQVWRFATEMPRDPAVFSAAHYVRAMAPLFGAEVGRDRSCSATTEREVVQRQAQPIRSTEMLYRCWEPMAQLAGTDNDTGHLASQVRDVFLDEYPSLLRGDRGAEAKSIAADFETWFLPIPKPGTAAPRDGQGRLTFEMGDATSDYDDEQQHRSSIDRPFQLAKYPVTNGVYALFDGRHFALRADYLKYTLPDPERSGTPHPDCPVRWVDWYDGTLFAWWVGGQLPTEHEWEYGCRASPDGPTTQWHCGDEETLLKTVAWYGTDWDTGVDIVGRREASSEDAARQPRAANAYGLYDLHGNVWEWTSSSYHADAEVGRQPRFVSPFRVLRGGAFNYDPSGCRSACRDHRRSASSDRDTGFRVSRAVFRF